MATFRFTIPLEQLAAKLRQDVDTTVRQITFRLFRAIVLKTPVDTGRARANWNVSRNAIDPTTSNDTDASRGPREAERALEYPAGSVVYLTNALPYIRVLEYGEYPNPPKRGTYLRKGQAKGDHTGPGYFIFSQNGYSKQAPQGMVRVSFIELQRDIEAILRQP